MTQAPKPLPCPACGCDKHGSAAGPCAVCLHVFNPLLRTHPLRIEAESLFTAEQVRELVENARLEGALAWEYEIGNPHCDKHGSFSSLCKECGFIKIGRELYLRKTVSTPPQDKEAGV